MKWYRLAADQEDAIAQFNLGFIYGNGEGVTANSLLAYVHFSLAASVMKDQVDLERARNYRDKVYEKLTPSQQEEV